ncbi:hypothetical protein BC939DRAFT_449218 [Gamsiella multidivaricata]|uniref:uncharacterized protein n=1 Tax=Gamsiella multidivaricata TaxID=101098 RepID=UPI0022208645|nr:uncharacterized protein BC939DRAFT_449218 [Gamsiella multidivaricata]KAG0368190.1 hypothetical protein BGZ54_002504 [Gamsiella multidivaricata]KAI7824783.1 hypothetical protein BC939DRAFT_449218 [Gamsiella multidivaricata]
MRASSTILLSSAILLLAATEDIHRRALNVVDAQVSVPGRFPANFAGSLYRDPPSLTSTVVFQYHHSDHFIDHTKIRGPPPTLRLPHLDNAQLLSDEEISRRQLTERGLEPDGAYQFGKAIAVESFDSISTLTRGRWISLKSLKHQRFMYTREDDEDVLVWQLEIYSQSALSLNLIFSEFHLPEGTEFFVSGRRHILGAFTAAINNKPDGIFATAPVAGDRLLLEYYTPKKTLLRGLVPRIQLSHVVHGYKPAPLAASSDLTDMGLRRRDRSFIPRTAKRSELRDQFTLDNMGEWDRDAKDEMLPPIRAMSGKCNVDVACHSNEYYEQSRSVGVILTDYNQKYCTGALVNNARQDGRQLFLTANHCSEFPDTSAHIVMFNHEKLQCGSNSEVVNEHDTAMGLVKLGNYAPSDYTLYEIVELIPDAYNLYLSGWSALPKAPSSRPRTPAPPPPSEEGTEEILSGPWRTTRSNIKDRVGRLQVHRRKDPTPHFSPMVPEDDSATHIPIVGIHHPSGDSKKISFFFNGTLPRACWAECGLDEYFHWKIPRWDKGTTEPGSSGSPLFDADKRIVGQLHGGSASCWDRDGYDAYGAIHASFQTPPKIKNRLATYLDPEGEGVKVMDGRSLEIARRETRERKEHEGEQESGEVMKETEQQWVGPLGSTSMEKPLGLRGEDKRWLFSRAPDMFGRTHDVIEKTWQRRVQRLEDLEEEDG